MNPKLKISLINIVLSSILSTGTLYASVILKEDQSVGRKEGALMLAELMKKGHISFDNQSGKLIVKTPVSSIIEEYASENN